MSSFKLITEEVPDVIVNPGKMADAWRRRARGAGVLAAVLLYAYFVLFLKTMYLRDQRLHRLDNQVQEAQKMIESIQRLDQQLQVDLELLNKYLPNPDY